MTFAERIQRMVELLPDDSSLTLPISALRAWIAGDEQGAPRVIEEQFAPDLTIEQVASTMRRKPSTIRGWLNAGRIPGAYKLNGKEWRVPPLALRSFQEGQRSQPAEPKERLGRSPKLDLGSWRNETGAWAT